MTSIALIEVLLLEKNPDTTMTIYESPVEVMNSTNEVRIMMMLAVDDAWYVHRKSSNVVPLCINYLLITLINNFGN